MVENSSQLWHAAPVPWVRREVVANRRPGGVLLWRLTALRPAYILQIARFTLQEAVSRRLILAGVLISLGFSLVIVAIIIRCLGSSRLSIDEQWQLFPLETVSGAISFVVLTARVETTARCTNVSAGADPT